MVEVGLSQQGVARVYEAMERRLDQVRNRVARPLTLSEKILFAHLDDPEAQEFELSRSYLSLRPDRVTELLSSSIPNRPHGRACRAFIAALKNHS